MKRCLMTISAVCSKNFFQHCAVCSRSKVPLLLWRTAASWEFYRQLGFFIAKQSEQRRFERPAVGCGRRRDHPFWYIPRHCRRRYPPRGHRKVQSLRPNGGALPVDTSSTSMVYRGSHRGGALRMDTRTSSLVCGGSCGVVPGPSSSAAFSLVDGGSYGFTYSSSSSSSSVPWRHATAIPVDEFSSLCAGSCRGSSPSSFSDLLHRHHRRIGVAASSVSV